MLKQKLLLPALIAWLLNSCSYDATQLYVVHQTVIGIDAAVNNEQKAGHLLIGYDRRFLTISPKSVPMSNLDTIPQETMAPQPTKATSTTSSSAAASRNRAQQPKDVMAVLSCSHLEIDGLLLTT